MNIAKAAGVTNVSGKFLKSGANFLIPNKTNLQNMKLFHKIFHFSKRLPDCQIQTIIQKGLYNTFLKLSANFISLFDIKNHWKSDSWLNSSLFRWKKLLYIFQSGFRKKLFYRLVSSIFKQGNCCWIWIWSLY